MARGEFTEKTRELIKERADHRCELCGIRMAYGPIHHRQPRGMGGTRLKTKASCSNGIYVHTTCHNMIESDRSRAYMMGWLVRMGASAESQEIKLWDGWFLLTPDGERLPYSPE
jgi:hypothetical protein